MMPSYNMHMLYTAVGYIALYWLITDICCKSSVIFVAFEPDGIISFIWICDRVNVFL
jgi:hypothetical protein